MLKFERTSKTTVHVTADSADEMTKFGIRYLRNLWPEGWFTNKDFVKHVVDWEKLWSGTFTYGSDPYNKAFQAAYSQGLEEGLAGLDLTHEQVQPQITP